MLHFLLIPLKLELDLVLGSPLRHLRFVLNRLPPLFFLDLRSLNPQVRLALFQLELARALLLQRQVERFFGVLRVVQVFCSL